MTEFKRGKRADYSIASRMIYESRCGRYRLEEHTSLLQDRVCWYAIDNGQMIQHMRTYRTRRAATKAIAMREKGQL